MLEPTYKLEVFEGPLDLLLSLLGRKKIEIWDINISQILEQYMEYLDRMQRMDMEITGEFLSMASYLIHLKSRMLLPMLDEPEEQEDPRAELARSLEIYRQTKERAKLLSVVYDGAGQTFVREAAPLPAGREEYSRTHSPELLKRAMERVLSRNDRRMPPPVNAFHGIVGRERVPVSVRVSYVLKMLTSRGKLKFLSLFRSVRSRSEIVATFLAVLELAKSKRVDIEDGTDGYTIEMSRKGA